jgi:tetratricopeptide (TPR) repeat protein
MKKTFLFIATISICLCVGAQEKPNLHSPAEIIKIMEASPMHYSIGELEKPIRAKDQSTNLNFNNVFRVTTKEGFETQEYTKSEKLKNMEDKAEEAFGKDKPDDARKFYLKALDIDPKYYTIMTYVGQTYGIEKNWEKAIEWYEKTIKLNYIDYMAHWFLADAYYETGKLEEAKKEILTAHILNRNNPRIIVSLKRILKQSKLEWKDWTFTPQITITKKTNDTIDIKYGKGWLTYALTKAVWLFEPGYRQKMGYENENTWRELEEKEALVGMIISEDEDTQSLPETVALIKATENTDNNMLQEFVFYEILLKNHPSAAYQFPEELINAIAEYLLAVRCEKK